MNDSGVTVRLRTDGTLVQLLPDGSQRAMAVPESRAMDDKAIEAAALADPEAQPLSVEQLARMKRVSNVKRVRRSLQMTQEEFAARFHLSLATLRDWEQGRSQPDQATSAYLEVIGRAPDVVMRVLGTSGDQAAQG